LGEAASRKIGSNLRRASGSIVEHNQSRYMTRLKGWALRGQISRPLRFITIASVFLSVGNVGLAQTTHVVNQQRPTAQSAPEPASSETWRSSDGLTVLILGDSLGLCGFGKRLDEHFRQMPQVKSTFTYMACGTNPLSWLKERPYTNIKTPCGFWSIESDQIRDRRKEIEDVYGMRRGSIPKSHPVPKLEDLLSQVQPDILVMQTGGNLFDLFPDHKTVRPERDRSALKRFVMPFIARAAGPSSSLRRIYWVGAPTSGRVSKVVQDFVVEQVRVHLGPAGTVIDSRSLVSYPYHHMEPDHEHFEGKDMDEWADKVFETIKQDLSSQPLPAQRLSELLPTIPASTLTQLAAPAEAPPEQMIDVRARLVFKSKPMRIEELMPYQESLVGFLYDVREVLAGQYQDKRILVMHPAHIGLRKQPLRKYRIGRTYKLRVRQLDGTRWNTVKRKDDSGSLDLQPYIQVEDDTKYPEANESTSN
jgi:hypothetical protein